MSATGWPAGINDVQTSKKSILVKADAKRHQAAIKNLGGKWSDKSGGYIFPLDEAQQVYNWIIGLQKVTDHDETKAVDSTPKTKVTKKAPSPQQSDTSESEEELVISKKVFRRATSPPASPKFKAIAPIRRQPTKPVVSSSSEEEDEKPTKKKVAKKKKATADEIPPELSDDEDVISMNRKLQNFCSHVLDRLDRIESTKR